MQLRLKCKNEEKNRTYYQLFIYDLAVAFQRIMRETNLGYALIHSAKAEIRLSEVSAAFWFLLHTSEAKLGQSLQPGSNVDLW